MQALLSLRGIAKSFGKTRVLEDVHLDVFPGEVVALVGENGSGKSTTSRIIAGVIQPDSGEVIIDGVVEPMLRPKRARELGVCYVSQEPALVPTMSVRENLGLPDLRWWRRARRMNCADWALAEVGLACDPDQKVETLSAAQQAQLEIATALLAEPRLLVLDEVTTRMPDPSVLLALLERLAEQGVGSILITHRFNEIKVLADRAVVLRDGHIVGDLAREDVTDARLGEMMV
ncbi:ATP-binding cassette domain-containing protein [Rhodoglobus vestalii]|uniref:ATP-binding cassette domain-containing protein n=1 Tax=Rhodoglobus vestalii TaxID=193384 RepID=UPI001150B587|nr:ATP-binding cassette domain-containing protein [Rhodoglobus vestalii]